MPVLLLIAALLIALLSAPVFVGVVTTSTGLGNAQMDRLFNGAAGTNFDSGRLEIWSGSPPGASNAPTGTKLWEETLPADAFAAASAKAVAGNGTWQANAIATGTAGYWRLVKSGDLGTTNTTDERLEGTVTATGGGGDMTLQTTSITNGQQITINTKTLTHG